MPIGTMRKPQKFMIQGFCEINKGSRFRQKLTFKDAV